MRTAFLIFAITITIPQSIGAMEIAKVTLAEIVEKANLIVVGEAIKSNNKNSGCCTLIISKLLKGDTQSNTIVANGIIKNDIVFQAGSNSMLKREN